MLTDLGLDAEHLEAGRHVQAASVDVEVAEVGRVLPAPDAQVVDVVYGGVSRQGQHHRLAVVAFERVLAAVLIRHDEAGGGRFAALAGPEVRVYGRKTGRCDREI